ARARGYRGDGANCSLLGRTRSTIRDGASSGLDDGKGAGVQTAVAASRGRAPSPSRREPHADLTSVRRTAARAREFSWGSPIDIRAHRSYGEKARPIATPSFNRAAANSASGMPVSKKTKLPPDGVNFNFRSWNSRNHISRS